MIRSCCFAVTGVVLLGLIVSGWSPGGIGERLALGADSDEGAASAAHEEAGHDAKGGDHSDEHDSGDHGGHHNPYDLSHANATATLEDPSEFKSDLAIYTFILFLLLLIVLWKFAWGPIIEGLARREERIREGIEESERAAEKARQQIVQYEQKMAGVADEVRELMDEARRDAEATRQRVVAEAQDAASAEKDRALHEIELAKYAALHEVTQQSVNKAVDLAGKIVRRELNASDHDRLIRETLSNLPSTN